MSIADSLIKMGGWDARGCSERSSNGGGTALEYSILEMQAS